MDKQTGETLSGYYALASVIPGRLQRPYHGGADGDHPTPCCRVALTALAASSGTWNGSRKQGGGFNVLSFQFLAGDAGMQGDAVVDRLIVNGPNTHKPEDSGRKRGAIVDNQQNARIEEPGQIIEDSVEVAGRGGHQKAHVIPAPAALLRGCNRLQPWRAVKDQVSPFSAPTSQRSDWAS